MVKTLTWAAATVVTTQSLDKSKTSLDRPYLQYRNKKMLIDGSRARKVPIISFPAQGIFIRNSTLQCNLDKTTEGWGYLVRK